MQKEAWHISINYKVNGMYISFPSYTQDDKIGLELLARYSVLHCFVFLNKDTV